MERRELPIPLSRMVYKERVSVLYKFERSKCPVTNSGAGNLHELAKEGSGDSVKKYVKSSRTKVDVFDPEDGLTPLMSACYHDNLGAVKALIELGANVNYKCQGLNGHGLKYSNVTPIYIAACMNACDSIVLLMSHGADVNQQCSPQGYTPLHRAIANGNAEAVTVLLKHPKIDLNIPCYDGMYPLHSAVYHPFILSALINSKNIDPNVSHVHQEFTPLHLAAYKGLNGAIKMLAQCGANINAEMLSGLTPLDLAIQQGGKAAQSLLIRAGATKKRVDETNIWLPWGVAVKYGPIHMKRKVLNGFHCIDAPIIGGSTALHHMVLQEKLDSCMFLLMKGANVNKQDLLGNTPLHLAAAIGNVEIMKLLLEHGARINEVNSAFSTPLQSAVESGLYSAVKLLVTKGADLYIERHEGGHALFTAVDRGFTGIVALLLKHGMSPNSMARIDTYNDTSVLNVAIAGQHDDIIKILVEAGADVNVPLVCHMGVTPPLQFLAFSDYEKVETYRLLIEAGAFIDAEVKTGYDYVLNSLGAKKFFKEPFDSLKGEAGKFCSNTVHLFKAVRKNDLKMADEYYKKGGTVNCCSKKFNTPLVYASWKGYSQMVRFLLDKGANVNKSGPLHYAAKFNHKEIVIELLRRGVDVKQLHSGKTALVMARENKNVEIATLLEVIEKWLESSECRTIPDMVDKSKDEIKDIADKLGSEINENDLCELFKKM